jgi:BASS family bile acid:Na+ symporter
VINLLSALIIFIFRDRFSSEIYLGLVIASTTPAGISVIFLSHLYGGSLDKSLVISFLSNVLSPLLLPVVVFFLAGEVIQVDWLNMVRTIVKLVVIPVGLALLARRTFLKEFLKAEGTYISIGILFFLVTGVIAPVGQMLLADIDQSIFLAIFVLLLITINFGIGFWLGSDHKAKVTYAISMSYKNFTLAMVIALTLFSPAVAIPAAIYTVMNNLFLIPLQLILVRGKIH